MVEMLSPGVFISEIDGSTQPPTVSSSFGVFAGQFDSGPVDDYLFITSVDELIEFYGRPNDTNYNDWYQAYNFLQYGDKLYVARAANTNGNIEIVDGETTSEIVADTTDTLSVSDPTKFKLGDYISLGGSDTQFTFYEVIAIDDTAGSETITLDRNVEDDIPDGSNINYYFAEINGVFEAVDSQAAGEAVTEEYEYLKSYMTINNFDDFEMKYDSIAFANSSDSKIKIIARNPGDWSKNLEVAIATPSAFNSTTPSLAFDGVALDDLFEYSPVDTEVGIIIRRDGIIKETFTVDFDPTAKDNNDKSTYIENVINNNSNLIFVKNNTANTDTIKDYIFEKDGTAGSTIELALGASTGIQEDDLLNAYELWANKEYVEIDIVIANELDGGVSAKNLVETRKDAIAFIGARYSDTVGKKLSLSVADMIEWRKTGDLNFNSMFCVAAGNYKYQYDKLSVA